MGPGAILRFPENDFEVPREYWWFRGSLRGFLDRGTGSEAVLSPKHIEIFMVFNVF